METKRTALIAGATGLTGKFLLQRLIESGRYGKIKVLTRKSIGENSLLVEEIITDFKNLEKLNLISQDVYCTLGTTMKKAGSKEAFYYVDHDLPLEIAKEARKQGASQFLLVSALGSDTKSKFYYNRVKGETEAHLKELGFEGLHIFRPSLLLGPREEHRTGEAIAMKLGSSLSFIFSGPLKKYKPMHVDVIAQAMVQAASMGPQGVKIYEPDDILKLKAENHFTFN